jgi:hypothetical protein
MKSLLLTVIIDDIYDEIMCRQLLDKTILYMNVTKQGHER